MKTATTALVAINPQEVSSFMLSMDRENGIKRKIEKENKNSQWLLRKYNESQKRLAEHIAELKKIRAESTEELAHAE